MTNTQRAILDAMHGWQATHTEPPMIAWIARVTGLSRYTVHSTLWLLCGRGLVERTKRTGRYAGWYAAEQGGAVAAPPADGVDVPFAPVKD